MKLEPSRPQKSIPASLGREIFAWLPGISWGVAVVMTVLAALVIWRSPVLPWGAEAALDTPVAAPVEENETITPPQAAELPAFSQPGVLESVARLVNPRTIIPNRSRSTVEEYTVQKGDSVFSIANKFKLKPETVLWANYDQLTDNPNMLSIGMVLKIPPVDGVYYQWSDGDTLEKIAGDFKVSPTDITTYPGNRLDMTNPVIEPGAYVMVPGGWRENRQWLVPTYWRPNAGASQTIAGPGGCTVPSGGAYGVGYFIWPTINHYLSGNDYWSGHLGIDIAAATTAPVYAADSGVVVYAGAIGGGYGNMIMIDHGNGYHTLYAHLDSVAVYCGNSVYQGQLIGLAGSTGNSTGPHLHFEVRYQGGFINPWTVLP